MNCSEVEILLCDYVDGLLAAGAGRSSLEQHLNQCAACRELAHDAAAATAFIRQAETVEPPPELVTRILFQIPTAAAAPRSRGRLRTWLAGWLQPVLQPRFAMGMAMTILSFSMLGKFASLPQRQLSAADLNPVKVYSSVEDRVQRTWDRAVKYYENLKLVYEIQSRLKEWTDQEESERKAQASGVADRGASKQGKGAAAPAEGER